MVTGNNPLKNSKNNGLDSRAKLSLPSQRRKGGFGARNWKSKLGPMADTWNRRNPHADEVSKMADHESQRKWAPKRFPLHRHSTDNRYSPWAEIRHILELIFLEAPLPGTLNKLCAMIDVQIGNVVSLVSLPDEEESHLCLIVQIAMQCGLHVFSSTSILSRDKSLLGTFQIYCCDQRRPTAHEFQLIKRVIHLAAVALQRHKDAEDFDRSSRHLRSAIGRSAPERPPFIN